MMMLSSPMCACVCVCLSLSLHSKFALLLTPPTFVQSHFLYYNNANYSLPCFNNSIENIGGEKKTRIEKRYIDGTL